MCHQKNLNRFLAATLVGLSLVGCAKHKLIKQNTDTGIGLVATIGIYESMQYKGGLPKTLNDLVSVGLLKEVPRCKCADGKMRDFIYISGYNQTISPNAILASPPEMDSKVTIVFYMGLTAKALSREEAAREIEKSRAFVKSMQEDLKRIMAPN